jgi:hypothetical protein
VETPFSGALPGLVISLHRKAFMKRVYARPAFSAGFLAVLVLAGCSSAKIKTHPVNGKIQLADGDIAVLEKSSVELMQDADPTLRPSGVIQRDGRFQIKTFHDGEFLVGAPEGIYKARIILADESDEGVPKRKGDPIHRRFLDFQTSGLSITVPSSDVTLSLTKK